MSYGTESVLWAVAGLWTGYQAIKLLALRALDRRHRGSR